MNIVTITRGDGSIDKKPSEKCGLDALLNEVKNEINRTQRMSRAHGTYYKLNIELEESP